MEKEMLEKIVLLADDTKFNGSKFTELCNSSCDLVARVNDYYYDDKNKVKRTLLLSKMFVLAMRALYQENKDVKRRETAVCKVFSIPKGKVTGDLTTFISSEVNYPIYVSDFQYDASVSLNRMANLEMVWGDAKLQKLHDFQWLHSLKVVMGDVYTSDAINTQGMNNLEVVTGDLHLEKLNQLPKLDKLSYVGGSIYGKNGAFKLEELKNSPKKLVK